MLPRRPGSRVPRGQTNTTPQEPISSRMQSQQDSEEKVKTARDKWWGNLGNPFAIEVEVKRNDFLPDPNLKFHEFYAADRNSVDQVSKFTIIRWPKDKAWVLHEYFKCTIRMIYNFRSPEYGPYNNEHGCSKRGMLAWNLALEYMNHMHSEGSSFPLSSRFLWNDTKKFNIEKDFTENEREELKRLECAIRTLKKPES
ncbi:hypothetical protein P154DRAFT_531143 [Amniculicola lignicola CBS 123094]|uniref:Uncharacterized protein n=1 Tax=Amniculicola lignicola CBS 123094 TaxID=1392246 RepID=A0A6A5WTH6_9PLEO|nr:hypothetical protein P154DRAFT_531143 [Amniculicola lignicola CBS 123094]